MYGRHTWTRASLVFSMELEPSPFNSWSTVAGEGRRRMKRTVGT